MSKSKEAAWVISCGFFSSVVGAKGCFMSLVRLSDYIESLNSGKEPVNVRGFESAKNTIFNQVERVKLRQVDVEAMRLAHAQLVEAAAHVERALLALNEFEYIQKRELLNAGRLIVGYNYMLGELLNQQSGALNHAVFKRGWGQS